MMFQTSRICQDSIALILLMQQVCNKIKSPSKDFSSDGPLLLNKYQNRLADTRLAIPLSQSPSLTFVRFSLVFGCSVAEGVAPPPTFADPPRSLVFSAFSCSMVA